MRPVGQPDRQRGLRGADARDRGAVVKIFLAVAFERRVPPCLTVTDHAELGQFLGDVGGGEVRLTGEFKAERDRIVEQARDDPHPTVELATLLERRGKLVVMVADAAPLAPRLLPALVDGPRDLVDQREVAQHLRRVGEQETELRIADQRLPRSGNRVVDAALAVGREREREGPVGRGRPNHRVGQRRRREQCGEREEQLRNEPHHSISSITAA